MLESMQSFCTFLVLLSQLSASLSVLTKTVEVEFLKHRHCLYRPCHSAKELEPILLYLLD